jgi:hypothetical protein
LFVGKRFSLDSDLIIGRNYSRFGPGIIGLPLWYFGTNLGFDSDHEDNSISNFLFLSAIMILSGEHFAYHIPVKNTTDISSYISLLRFKQMQDARNSENQDKMESSTCFALGIEINILRDLFCLHK